MVVLKYPMHNELCACGERRKGRALASSKASSKACSNASKAPLQVVRGGKGARSLVVKLVVKLVVTLVKRLCRW